MLLLMLAFKIHCRTTPISYESAAWPKNVSPYFRGQYHNRQVCNSFGTSHTLKKQTKKTLETLVEFVTNLSLQASQPNQFNSISMKFTSRILNFKFNLMSFTSLFTISCAIQGFRICFFLHCNLKNAEREFSHFYSAKILILAGAKMAHFTSAKSGMKQLFS